jgi:hypothetical protein
MHVETKFLWLIQAVELGDDIDGWRVCWLGGWDKRRLLFVVMVKRVTDTSGTKPPCRSDGETRSTRRSCARCSNNQRHPSRRAGAASL